LEAHFVACELSDRREDWSRTVGMCMKCFCVSFTGSASVGMCRFTASGVFVDIWKKLFLRE
jgi:hypothetical protein